MSSRSILVAALAASILVGAPLALADTGDPIREGIRNPSSGDAQRETQIIARTGRDTYGTRQSNLGAGGGAIYGCRSSLDVSSPQAVADPEKSTPCLRVNNLRGGKAFDLVSDEGRLVGVIQAGNSITTPRPGVAPFVTNATSVAVGLNADRVDGLSASEIIAQATQAARSAGGGGAAGGACPANTSLVGGGCIENAPRAAATYAAAAAACGAAGRRLVPPDVLLHARTLEGIDLGAGEMSADVTVASVVALTGTITRGYTTVNDAGDIGSNALTATAQFRCITG